MKKCNLVYLNTKKVFSQEQLMAIRSYVEAWSAHLGSKAILTFHLSDESEQYATVVNDRGVVVCHIAKTRKGYIADCLTFGYREAATLTGVLLVQGTPLPVEESLKKAFA